MATKKKATTKRPPRQLWIVFNASGRFLARVCRTRAEAKEYCAFDQRIVGPYVLAERVSER